MIQMPEGPPDPEPEKTPWTDHQGRLHPQDSRMLIGEFLGSLPLFSGLSETRLAALAQECRLKQVPRGACLFLQGDPADALFVVRSGSFAILLSSLDGRELVINEMRPGDCFGELGLLTGLSRSTNAVARAPGTSEVLVIPRDAFMAILEKEPLLSRRLLETIAQRLRNSSEREGALAFLDAQARLARVLLGLDDQASERGYVTISQEELAQRTGLTRQTVAKALGRWRRRGWLITGRGHIMLLNRAQLQKFEQHLNGSRFSEARSQEVCDLRPQG
jgi:CRP/FNR family transcriptional regulator, cyclic AMP receptor protein